MSREKVIIAHCAENGNIASDIASDLASTGFDFQLVACENRVEGDSLREQIGITDDKIILLISDNFLKSNKCMDGGLSYLQKLINSGRTLPVVIDGTYQEEGGVLTAVPTKFERVSSVIKYMNFWQDEYLDMRKQKRSITPDKEEAFNKRLKVVRSISSEVGEFLRFLRESYYCDYTTFTDKEHLLFFQKFSNEDHYKAFIAQPKTQRPSSPTVATVAAASVIGASAAAATEIATEEKPKPSLEEVSPGSNVVEMPTEEVAVTETVEEVGEEITIPIERIPEPPTVAEMTTLVDSEIIEEIPTNPTLEETATVTEEPNLDSLVEDILEAETVVVEEIAISETPIIPDHQEVLEGDELLDPELATVFPELKEEVSDEEIDKILEDLVNDQETDKEVSEENSISMPNPAAIAGIGIAAATMATSADEIEEPEEINPIKTDVKPLKESDLLRTSHELIQQGGIEDGLFLLKSNLAINPEMVAARYQYAVFLAQFHNDYRAASEQLEVILNKDPKNLPANFFLGELAEAQGDFLSARSYYEKVEKINPNFPNLNYKMGMLLSRRYKGNSELTASHLQKAYEKNGRNIEALYQLGVIQNEGLSMPLDAIESFKKVLKEKPSHDFVNYDLALAYYKIGDKQEAANYYEKACVLNPELKTEENDLAFAITEDSTVTAQAASDTTSFLDTSSTSEESAISGIQTASLVGAMAAGSVSAARLNGQTSESTTAVLEETPDYTLDLLGDSIDEVIEKEEEPLPAAEVAEAEKNLAPVDSSETETSTTKPVAIIVDEEQLEAEFDAQIDALGAAGFGIAAGALVKDDNTADEKNTTATATTIETEVRATASFVSNEIKTKASAMLTIKDVYTNGIVDKSIVESSTTTKINLEPSVEPPTSKVVLITGATSGIGKATAALFAKNGYDLILTGRRFSRLFKLKSEFETAYNSKIQLLPFDVRSSAAVKSAIGELAESWRNVDVLINNAGLAMGFDPIHEGNLDDWDAMIDTNIKGLLYMTRAISPYMVKRNKGHIINISSIAGKEVYPNGNVYCATKHAVEALTKSMRIDLHKYNIRVSQIAPGHVEDTEFAQVRFHGDKERAKIYNDFVPINSSDVAEMIYFIATRPAHVNVQDILMMGTQQASAMITDRSGRGE